VVRSCWDYVPRRAEFLAWAQRVPRLANPAEVLAWNTDKRYLRELAAAGVPVVPTTWVAPGRAWNGRPLLMELELTEPQLFLGHAPGAADRLAAAITAGHASRSHRHLSASAFNQKPEQFPRARSNTASSMDRYQRAQRWDRLVDVALTRLADTDAMVERTETGSGFGRLPLGASSPALPSNPDPRGWWWLNRSACGSPSAATRSTRRGI
jgi:hypothetical protein